ncbi:MULTISPECIES: plasmid replication protein RepC [unclassified Rhizobium]|mgnify:FL=1|jgi:replication initiation protein RepC|uniref:plasmid replication protein RepC n=1 Tax=unclassified Rhizobium TaxID=2613769 RepID=UPI0006485E12|nr:MULTISPECIES: plasmid replication protein RepC [unclassified Rhizobium]OJY68212.1 MAG: replication initiation protein RepC [Rhizobium sp. 60-20]RKD35819.1 replication initiation protein RepC [Rhizobium sp. WW_1]
MQNGSLTTPFGRRPMTLALIRQQIAVTTIEPKKTVDKWKVFRDASEAREKLGLQDRSLAVLDALLSFYPDNELRQDAKLIVFPSNAQLTLRAHGIAGATLRRHLALLIEAGLIVRRDSANGKRYARKGRDGEIENAFGFDISPLLHRAEELAIIAQQVVADRIAFRRAKESLTICRRDVRKLIAAAIMEGVPGNWTMFEENYTALAARISRSPTMSDIDSILECMELLRGEIINLLETQEKVENLSTNDAHSERHIQNSNPESLHESEQPSRTTLKVTSLKQDPVCEEPMRIFPLALVLKACPEISSYGPTAVIGSWRDLMSAAIVVRSMLGVSPSTYQHACEIMGPENAAVTMACILERSGNIKSAGAYLQDLTAKARRREFSLGPALMALLRANSGGGHTLLEVS